MAEAIAPSDPEVGTARVGVGNVRSSPFNPYVLAASRLVKDKPLFTAVNGKWADRQQHGRLPYDAMMSHGIVSGPFGSLAAYLKSYKPLFKPRNASPTERQKMLADFANAQIDRLASSGDPRQGWGKVIEWFAMGLRYGFTLSEMETVLEAWRGRPRVQVGRLVPLPQASLDLGFIPREEFGENIISGVDPRYRCFEMDNHGRITAVHQYWRDVNSPAVASKENRTTWVGQDLLRILHYARGGADGNPFGESILFPAYRHWASYYTLECEEDVFLNTSLPYLGVSYKTPDGRPSPAIHDAILKAIEEQDPARRLLVLPDATYSSVAPSNPNFTDHVEKKMVRLLHLISEAIGVPHPVYAESAGREASTREIIAVFFGNFLPSILSDISDVMTWQFSKRLIDANWTNVQNEDYPVLTFRMVLNEDIRVAMPLLQQSLNMVDTDKLGDFLQSFVPGFDRDFIPINHSQSVASRRMPTEPAKTNQPPRKEPGSIDQNGHGRTGNPSGEATVV